MKTNPPSRAEAIKLMSQASQPDPPADPDPRFQNRPGLRRRPVPRTDRPLTNPLTPPTTISLAWETGPKSVLDLSSGPPGSRDGGGRFAGSCLSAPSSPARPGAPGLLGHHQPERPNGRRHRPAQQTAAAARQPRQPAENCGAGIDGEPAISLGFVADRISDVVVYRDRDLRSGALRGKGRPRKLVDFDQLVTEDELAGLWVLSP